MTANHAEPGKSGTSEQYISNPCWAFVAMTVKVTRIRESVAFEGDVESRDGESLHI
jgi:hypothetical protein